MNPSTPFPAVPPAAIEIWFEFGSNYSYLSVMRIEALCAQHALHLRWRPFLLGPIFKHLGWDTSPFVTQQRKGRYVWRDMERQCEKYALAWRKPSQFPRRALLPMRVAVLASDETWMGRFCKQVMRENFVRDRDIDSPEVVGRILRDLDLDAEAVLAAGGCAGNKARLRQQTEDALALGIFGAPMFRVGSDLFWGNDRLDEALAAASRDRT